MARSVALLLRCGGSLAAILGAATAMIPSRIPVSSTGPTPADTVESALTELSDQSPQDGTT